jgi:hypothetical protein
LTKNPSDQHFVSVVMPHLDDAYFRRRCSICGRQGFDVLGYHQRFRPVSRKPGEGRVSRDGKKPSTRVAAGVAIEPSQCPQIGFLDNIFRVGAIAGKPAGQRVALIEAADAAAIELAIGALPPPFKETLVLGSRSLSPY